MHKLQSGLQEIQRELTQFFLMLAAADTPEGWEEAETEVKLAHASLRTTPRRHKSLKPKH